MATIIQRVDDVQTRDVNTRRGAGVVYDIILGDGTKASTFDSDLGNKARQFVGQMAKVDLTSKPSQDGRYTNVYLNSIEPADAGATPTTDAPVTPGPRTDDETAARIARTSALRYGIDVSIAANVPGQISWNDVEDYTHWILTGEGPNPLGADDPFPPA